jgi:hypothetical protein
LPAHRLQPATIADATKSSIAELSDHGCIDEAHQIRRERTGNDREGKI